jgi:uncharacterized protein (DUF2147 family)
MNLTRIRKVGILVCAVVSGLLAFSGPGHAQSHELSGRWLVEKKDAIILVEPQGDGIVGRIVWAKDRDGIKGDERLDTKNPRPDLRSRKVLGLDVLTGIPATPQKDGWYGRGRIYNPKTGKSYNVKLRLDPNDQLRLRIGGGVLGQTTRWTRAN